MGLVEPGRVEAGALQVGQERRAGPRDGPAVRAGGEHVGQGRPAVLALGDLQHLADVTVLAAAAVGVVPHADLDDEVDAAGDEQIGELRRDVRAGLQRARHEALDRGPAAVRVGGAQGAGRGLGGLEHRDDLGPADLTDDDPRDVRAQHRVQQPVQGDLTGRPSVDAALAGTGTAFVGGDAVVPVGHLVEVQLELGLDRRDALPWVQFVAQRPDQGGFAGALRSGHHDCLAGPDRRAQELGQDVVDHPEALQVGQVDVGVAVDADDDGRAGAAPGAGGQAVPAVQAQVQLPVQRRERPAGLRGQERQGLDEFLVAVSDRRADLHLAVAVDQVHAVVAADLDVLHVGVVHQRLQTAEPEQRVEDRGGQGVLRRRGRGGTALGEQAVGVVVEHARDQRPADLAAGRLSQARPVA